MYKQKLKEKVAIWIAWRLPRSIVKWCGFRILSHATTGKWGSTEIPGLKVMDAMERWGEQPLSHERVTIGHK